MTTLERPRLLRLLDAALADRHVVITAPAGYGKSTVLRHLSRSRPQTHLLSLTPADVDLSVLQHRIESLLTTGTTLLLDAVQHVEGSPEVQAWISQQLRREDVRFVLSSRTRLDWLLDTLLPQSRVLSLDEGTLRFTPAETETLLGSSHSQQSDEIDQWQQRLQGWPLGLGLLAQLTERPNPLSATRERLFRYLASAVFADLPPELRQFVQVSAMPLQFNDELVAHLLKSADARSLRQQVQQHNLFLEETEQPGWFRYHDLIRAFLLETAPSDLTPLYDQTVRWFAARGDLEAAIEQALDGDLQQTAVRLIEQLPAAFLFYDCRYLTYRRWVRALGPTVRDANPMLLIHLGNYLHYVPGLEAEAKAYLTHAAELTRRRGQTVENLWANIHLARIDVSEGNHLHAIHALQTASEHPDATLEQRRLSFEILSMILCDLARFREARRASAAMLALAGDTEERKLVQHRQNLAVALLLPLGEYAQAAEIMQHTLGYFAHAPAWQHHTLLNWCELCVAAGDWKAVAETLGKVESLQNAVESPDVQDQFWLHTYQAMLAIHRREWNTARPILAHLQRHVADYARTAIWAGVVEVWLLRRQGQWTEAVERAGEILDRQVHMPFERARLALERDTALGFAWIAGDRDEFTLHAETMNLIHWRCRAELVRLRALLALICWQRGDPRWRRHGRAALYACKTYPRYARLLTHRDPDLGAYFWALALIAGFAEEQALDALAEIGQWKPVLPLLRHADPPVRRSAAAALAAVGREEAMPPLHDALAAETDGDTTAAFERALATLEGQPPPPLQVQMMGGFALVRGDAGIPAQAWPRPIVLRLFQYFALHRGVALPRDRILEDLWPGTDPGRAWATFRSVYSRLRSVLEPFVRSKGPNRYVALEGDAYRFDPLGVVQIDFEQFESTVRGTLHAARTADVPPLSDAFLAALATYAPLLPELPYADWLLETRQRLDDLYADGCLYAAQALLVRGQPAEAQTWAQRAVVHAPWLEEGYQALMRALARQGQRSQALRVYETAVAALSRELDVPPSPQTEWLAERLRTGETI